MILAKCCHDMDILRWLIDKKMPLGMLVRFALGFQTGARAERAYCVLLGLSA